MLIQRKPSWLLLNGMNTAFSCIIHQCCHVQLMNSHLKLDVPGPQFQGYILSHIRKHVVNLIRDRFGNNSSAVQTMVSCIQTCSLIMILKSTPSNTSPLERSYSLLEMLCSPRRNQVLPEPLEVLYLLKALNLPVKSSAKYADAIELFSEGLV